MLKFLGKRKGGCKCGGRPQSWESKSSYKLYSPFGIKEFRRNNTYNFDDVNEYDFWKECSYFIKNVNYKYFEEVI